MKTATGYRSPMFFGPLCVLLLGTLQSQGQQTKQASFGQPTSRSANTNQQLTFRKKTTQIGDQSNQLLVVRTELNSTVRLAKTEIEKSTVKDIRQLKRVVTAAKVQRDQMVAARVTYVVSENEMHVDQQPAVTKSEPVVGKTYLCQRDNEEILVTDEQGRLPPLEEYDIVARGMESLGKPNPIAEFLHGKTIAVGQTVAMPPKLALQLLGLGETIDTVHRFDFTLTEIEQPAAGSLNVSLNSHPHAVFHAILEASSHDNGQMRMQIEGTMTIESSGCRLVAAELAGPIGIAESSLRAGNTLYITSTGQLAVSIDATYSDVR